MVVAYFWRIKPSRIPFALLSMALNRLFLFWNKNVGFHKSLGVGNGESFTPRDADPLSWGLIAVVNDIEAFDSSALISLWRKNCVNEFRAVLSPISSHGKWARQDPFTELIGQSSNGASYPSALKNGQTWNGPVVAITRARIKWHQNFRFWRSVPPVTISLKSAEGLINAIGIGEAPIGLQGTFSLWESASAVRDFAYRGQAHQKAIADTARYKWYSEELFARFALLDERGLIK
jgi:hypothetical protein